VSLEFNILAATPAGERRGQLRLPRQTVETPVFMPAGTAGTVKAVAQDVPETLGPEIILSNTNTFICGPVTRPSVAWAACTD
jgi:queuine tRNA-ribosyltransferase